MTFKTIEKTVNITENLGLVINRYLEFLVLVYIDGFSNNFVIFCYTVDFNRMFNFILTLKKKTELFFVKNFNQL